MRSVLLVLLALVYGCGKPEGIESCEVCGGDVSIKATECPHCGEQNPSPTIKARLASDRQQALAEAKQEEARLRLEIEQERAKPIQETVAAMQELRDRLTQHAEEHKRFPTEDKAKEIAFSIKDAWGFGLHFEYIDPKAGKYRVRSTGDELLLREFFIDRSRN